jgi:hypothetical protein
LSSVDRHYIAVIDGERKYVQVSENFCTLLAYSRPWIIAKRVDDLTAPDTNDIQARHSHSVLIGPQIHRLTGKPAPIVTVRKLRNSTLDFDAVQHQHHIFALQPLFGLDPQAFPT